MCPPSPLQLQQTNRGLREVPFKYGLNTLPHTVPGRSLISQHKWKHLCGWTVGVWGQRQGDVESHQNGAEISRPVRKGGGVDV